MDAEQVILLVLLAAIFASVLALGCRAKSAEVASLWRRPSLLFRSLAAMFLVTPAVTLVMIELLPLPRGVKIGLVLLSISCALPPNWKQMLALGGSPSYVLGLLFTTTLLAVVTVPLSLAVLTALPLGADESVPVLKVAGLVGIVFFAPLASGMFLQRFAPLTADRISGRVSGVAGVLLLACLLGLLAYNFSAVWEIDLLSYVTIAVLVMASLVLGHWLGGPEPGDRATLAIATAARFPGIAAVIAAANFPHKNAVVIIVAYLIVTLPLLNAYARWLKKQTAARFGEPNKEAIEDLPAKNASTATGTKS
jgi:BASS family bile acid:Na+ symporter